MIYAPIIIPTLNRYEHLKECIDSLRQNSWAIYTELYISLDYPPSDKYVDGYNRIKDYLTKGIDGFKNVVVIYQEENLGAFKNCEFLYNLVFEKHDRYIFTEDDNVFSKNYIEYMDVNLEKYENDETIYAINGYSSPIKWSYKKGLIKQNCYFSAWGYGIWKNRFQDLQNFKVDSIKNYLKNFSNALFLCKLNKHYFVDAVEIVRKKHYIAINENKELRNIDLVNALYMVIEDKCTITPIVSKVCNKGHDNTGVNCKKSQKIRNNINDYDYENQEIDCDVSYVESELYNCDKLYYKTLDKFYNTNWKYVLKAWIKWLHL